MVGRIIRGRRAWPRAALRIGVEDGTKHLSRGNIAMEVVTATGTLTGQFIHLHPVHLHITPAVGSLAGQNISLVRYVMSVTPAEGALTGQNITLLP